MNVKDLDKESFSVMDNVEEIFEARKKIKTVKKHQEFVNKVRNLVQEEAGKAVENGPKNCIVAMATGSGKTKVAIDYAKSIKGKQALLVPTEKLRDRNWVDEYEKWKARTLNKRTDKLCYASATKVMDKIYSLAILDEGHNITENNSAFLKLNNIKKTVLLTATVPDRKKDFDKSRLLNSLGFKVVFELTLDQAVKLGFVAPYEINIIEVPLESQKKTVMGGTKKKPFMTTELSKYNWLSRSVQQAMYSPKINAKFMILNRMRFIYSLPSKLEAAKYILNNIIPREERGLIFCSNINQAEELCEHSFHSKTSDEDYEAFKNEEIDRLSCVKALNEGHNFENLDFALVVQLTSKEKDLVQRIGRLVRMRPEHKANIFIVVSTGTQDEKWLDKATENLDVGSINYYNYKNINKYKFYEN